MLACLHTIQYLAILLCFSWMYLTKQCTHLIAKPADQCVSLAEKLCWHICRRWFVDSFFWCLEYSRPKVSTGCNLAEMNSFKLPSCFCRKGKYVGKWPLYAVYAVYALFWGSSQMSCWCFGSQIACVQVSLYEEIFTKSRGLEGGAWCLWSNFVPRKPKNL